MRDRITELEAELLAEREKLRKLGEQYKAEIHLRIDGEQQLAAERAKPKTTEYAQGWDDHVLAARSQNEELRKQLAAERDRPKALNDYIEERIADATKPLADALTRVKTGLGEDRPVLTEIIDAALAKVKNEH